MASVSNYNTHYEGTHLQPGQQHGWWMTNSAWGVLRRDFQINVTAYPIIYGPFLPPPPQELMVTDIRSRINENAGRVLLFNVRNTGPNPVGAYFVSFSYITD